MTHIPLDQFGGTDAYHPDWDRVVTALSEIAAARPGDGSGVEVPVPPGVIRGARAIVQLLAHDRGLPAPDGLYPLPDGEVVFEYVLPDDVVERYIVESSTKVQMMLSYPDARPASFRTLTVRAVDGFAVVAERRRRENRRWGGLNDFCLAA